MTELTDLVEQGVEWYNKLKPVYREIYLITRLTAIGASLALGYSYLRELIETRYNIKK